MKNVYPLLLSMLGLLCIIFNRFAVEETFRVMAPFQWLWPRLWPRWLFRAIAILSGTFLFFLGLLMSQGYLS